MADIKDSWIDTGKSFYSAFQSLTRSVCKTTIAGADAIRNWANTEKDKTVECECKEVIKCPECETLCPVQSRFCLHCGKKFE